VGGLVTNTDNGHCIIGNVLVVEGEAGRLDKLGAAMVGFVLGGLCKDGHEGMDSQSLVIWNDHENGEKGLPDGKQVVVGWLPFNGGEGIVGLFEKMGDCVSVHDDWEFLSLLANEGSISLGKKCRTVAVEDCNDDDQGNGVDKGELRVLGAFRNASECVGSRDCNCGSGSLIGIKLDLYFHCCREQGGPKVAADWINLCVKKSSIGGKQYLDYL
jgi:hypothetical protein